MDIKSPPLKQPKNDSNNKNTSSNKSSLPQKKTKKINRIFQWKFFFPILYIVIFCICIISFYFVYSTVLKNSEPTHLTAEQQAEFTVAKQELWPETILQQLPYHFDDTSLPINAESAIIIDTSNGSILYEKNANEIIPPASMTKLVVMYVVFQEIASGRIALEDIVPLPPESWAINLPKDSSIMFLGENQKVTVDELLQGMSVASGNDAAIAAALYISGSMNSFVSRMNYEMELLGLTNTHFVESSGYSEENLTTAKEFAAFAKTYITHYPESILNYHSQKSFSYPKEKNLPTYQQGQNRQPITQYNTNKALGQIEGVDGLKTGFIYESGYNLSLTAERNGTRFLSVTMKGPGIGSVQGNKYRIEDATTLMEWAFDSFTTAKTPVIETIPILVAGGKEEALYLVPTKHTTLTVPHIGDITAETLPNDIEVSYTIDVPKYLQTPVIAGQQYGSAFYIVNNVVLEEIPLIADRTIVESSGFKKWIDTLILETN